MKFFTVSFHKEMVKSLFRSDIYSLYKEDREPGSILKQGAGIFMYTYGAYIAVYFLLFLVGYSYFSRLNDIMRMDFEKKGLSSVSLFLNSYPWNVIYIFGSLAIFILVIAILSYGLTRLLEDGKRSFAAHLGICFHASSLLLVSLFVILIANTIFPFDQNVGVILFSILVAIWIIMFAFGIYMSTRVFTRATHAYFRQHKRRAMITWLIPFLFLMYSVFGIVTGI